MLSTLHSSFFTVLLFTVYCLLSTAPLFAHASLLSAEPTPGQTLNTVDAIVLTFSEPMGAASQIALIDENFGRTDLSVDVTEAVLSATVPPLDPGVYTVQYDAISADGHNILGSYEFAIEQPPTDVRVVALVVVLIAVLLLLPAAAVFLYRRNRL